METPSPMEPVAERAAASAASTESSDPRPNFRSAEVTTNDTTAAVSTVRIMGMCPPGGVTAK